MARSALTVALTVALALLGCSRVSIPERTQPPAPTPWPHETSDLKADPAVVWGRLDNGLRYAILPHDLPRGRISVCLLVQAGSYHEADDQLGYAHFVEHMAFRDTRDFPAHGAIAALQRLGAGFGAHVNATTGCFETDYRFDNLPSDEPDALATGLKILRAIADGVVFMPDGVEQERGVIIREDYQRDGVTAQAWRDQVNYLAPYGVELRGPEVPVLFGGTRLAMRSPIGTEATLRAATANNLRAFYERWYRPERMILTVAGDVTPAEVGQIVRRSFASLTGRGAPPAEIPVEDARNENGPARHHVLRDAEPVMRLTLGHVLDRSGVDTAERRREAVARRTALAMFNHRLELLTDRPDAAFVSGEGMLLHDIPGREGVVLRAEVRPAFWPRALAALDTEVRRATALGFTPAEFTRTVRRERRRLVSQTRGAARDSSAVLARSLAFAAARGVVFTAAADDQEREERGLDALTVTECDAALRALLPAERLGVALAGPFAPGTADPSTIDQVVRAGREAALTPFVLPPPPPPFPYTDFGPPGRVVKTEHDATLDAELVQFANGVRLNLKRTAFEPGNFRLSVRFGGGKLACPPDREGLDLRMFTWVFSGLRDTTFEEQRAMLADLFSASSSMTASISPTAFHLTGNLETIVLRLALQSAAAGFRWPAFRAEAWTRALEISRSAFAPSESVATGVAQAGLRWRMSGQHPAQRVPRLSEAAERTLAEFEAWFPSQLAGPIELALIGDFDREEALDAVARTFGALPVRAPDNLSTARQGAAAPTVPFSDTVSFHGMPGVAVVAFAWPGTAGAAPVDRWHADILAAVVEDRLWLKLRAEMGVTYSPSAALISLAELTPAPSFLQCLIETAPEHTERVAAAAGAVIATLWREGVTPEEFERARRPLLRQTESGLRDNEWWLDLLSVAQSNPAYAHGWAEAVRNYRTATVGDINAAARRWLGPERRHQLSVLPLAKSQTERQSATDHLASAEEKVRKNDFAGALADFDRALALNPNFASAYLNRASARYKQGDFDAAIADATRAIELEPGNALAFHNRAVARSGKGDLDGEMADYDRALALNPNLVDALAYRGAGWLIKGDLAAARRDLDRALELARNHIYALRQRAETRRRQGDEAGARADEARANRLAAGGN